MGRVPKLVVVDDLGRNVGRVGRGGQERLEVRVGGTVGTGGAVLVPIAIVLLQVVNVRLGTGVVGVRIRGGVLDGGRLPVGEGEGGGGREWNRLGWRGRDRYCGC